MSCVPFASCRVSGQFFRLEMEVAATTFSFTLKWAPSFWINSVAMPPMSSHFSPDLLLSSLSGTPHLDSFRFCYLTMMIWAMFLSYLLLEALCIVFSGCQIHLPFIRPRHVQNLSSRTDCPLSLGKSWRSSRWLELQYGLHVTYRKQQFRVLSCP